MLKREETGLIDLLDDSVDDFFTIKPSNLSNSTIEQVNFSLKLKTQNDTILNEEIVTQHLPASPPFTKVSTIKMYNNKTPLKNTKTVSPSNKSTLTKSTAIPLSNLGRKDHTKSYLPRIKKRQKQ